MPLAAIFSGPDKVGFDPGRVVAPEVSVCIASWNCVGLLRKCLQSLFGNPQGVRFEVVIADNASTDGAAEMVAAEFPQVVLIRNTTNAGFAAASNQAAVRARGRFLFFLNNDTEVPAQTLRRLLDHARANPAAGMFGPLLREADGSVQISYRRRPTLPALLHKLSVVRWTGLFRQAHANYRRGSFHPEGVRPVEVLMGSAVFVSRDVFEEVGGWDERYRFGVEDIDLSTQVGRKRAVVFAGDVEIVHHGRASSRDNIGYVASSVTTGYVQYFRKSGVRPWTLFWYKLAVTLNAPIYVVEKSVEAAARWATNQPREAKRSWATVRGLTSFLRYELVRFWRA
ncbi:MAG: glycosyltransferase family 2 protein [Planctomycetaceae bacterium]|nr:glycosyltransferase family 2 protein [Planctomycetaceae bacterium]